MSDAVSDAARDMFDALRPRQPMPDNQPGASIYVQWKGTDVCVDLHCACGAHGHVDGFFCYYWRCDACGATYALPDSLPLIPLTPEETAIVSAEFEAVTAVGDDGP